MSYDWITRRTRRVRASFHRVFRIDTERIWVRAERTGKEMPAPAEGRYGGRT
jgi:hypothetical protein